MITLNPIIDEDGLLRVGGRIGRSVLPYDAKHPLILDARHPLTNLILESYNRDCRHGGTDYVLSSLRPKFWIIAVKKIRRSCRRCIEEISKPSNQLMSELPSERMAIAMPPFYHTSIDYFGPFLVVQGRNKVLKRYGSIFTCMTTHCVHIEVAESLSTPDFLNALRRFINLRSSPSTIYSDNGTNFVGAEKELLNEINTLEQDNNLAEFAMSRSIKWKFQPPPAPHWGGVH